jgi:hypothetical protein
MKSLTKFFAANAKALVIWTFLFVGAYCIAGRVGIGVVAFVVAIAQCIPDNK